MRSAISSPLSSWRKWPASCTVSAGPAPGMSSAMRSAGLPEKMGSLSLNSTSAGFSHLESSSRTHRIFSAAGCDSWVGTSSGNISTPVFDSGAANDAHELPGTDVGADSPDEVPELEPGRAWRPAGEDPGVEDHEARHAVGMLDCQPEPDRPSPVLHHHGETLEFELVDEALDRLGVPVVRVPVAIHRLVGPAEPEVVRRDAPRVRREHGDHLAVQERPRRLAVQQHHRRPGSLVDVVEAQTVLFDVVRLELVAGESVEAIVRCAISVEHPRRVRRGEKRIFGRRHVGARRCIERSDRALIDQVRREVEQLIALGFQHHAGESELRTGDASVLRVRVVIDARPKRRREGEPEAGFELPAPHCQVQAQSDGGEHNHIHLAPRQLGSY